MIPIQNMKFVNALYPQLKDDGNLDDNNYVDVSGWGHIRFLIQVGNLDAALGSTAEGTAPYVEQCNTTNGQYTKVLDAELADAIADTEGGGLFSIDIALTKSHSRYMRLNAPHAGNGSTGVNAAAIAILSRPAGKGPASAAEAGLTELITA
jgi:hypothetical protein